MRLPKLTPEVQKAVLFFVGLAGVIHETLLVGGAIQRPWLLLMFASMMGVPIYFKPPTLPPNQDDSP